MTTANDPKWMKAQALSGTLFAVFLFMHLLNQMAAVLGARRYDELQGALRHGYQAPVLELVLVLGPLVAHVFIAVVRFWAQRGAEPTVVSWRVRLHRWSGRFLLVVFVGHVLATRGASFFYGVFPGFAGVAFTFRWVPSYFWPYYLLLALTGWYHLVHGLSTALPVLGVRAASVLHRAAVFNALVGLGGVALIFGVLSLGGVFFDVDPATSEYARLVQRLFSSGP